MDKITRNAIQELIAIFSFHDHFSFYEKLSAIYTIETLFESKELILYDYAVPLDSNRPIPLGSIPKNILYLVNLEKLDLYNFCFNKAKDIEVLSLLKKLKNLSVNNIYPEDKRFLQPLKEIASLESLTLTGDVEASEIWGESESVEKDFLIPIGNLLKLERLSINNFSSISRNMDFAIIKNLSNLKSLFLNSNGIGKGKSLCFLEKLTKLEYLDLSFNKLGNLFLKDFEVFRCIKNLKSIDLSNNKLGKGATNSFLQYLQNMSILEKLDLSNNLLKSKDLKYIHNFTKLKRLDLSNNRIGKVNGELSLQFLRRMKSLEFLDLSNNNLSELDFIDFEHLLLLPNLKELRLSNNNIDKVTKLRLIEALKGIGELCIEIQNVSDVINTFIKK